MENQDIELGDYVPEEEKMETPEQTLNEKMRKGQRKQNRRKTCIGRQGEHIAAKRLEREEWHTANILQDRFS
eukprot:7139889-Ditylum_brightwellii.AAC.1